VQRQERDSIYRLFAEKSGSLQECVVMQIVLHFGNVWPRRNATDQPRMRHNRSFAQPLRELLIAFARDYGRV
jgi:hypothetical protein